MTAWWVNEGGFPGILPGSNYGSGGNAAASGAVQFRSPLDAARAAGGRLPQAEYPDGYLGNITGRQSDKLLQNLQTRLTAQSFQRGVHKGSRIAPKDYFWPEGNVTPEAGLERQARGVRGLYTIACPKQSPTGDPIEFLAHMGKTSGMATPGELGRKMQEARDYGVNPAMNPIVLQDPQQQVHFAKLGPRYKTA